MGGLFSPSKIVKRAINPSRLLEDTGEVAGKALSSLTSGFASGLGETTTAETATDEAAALEAEAEEDKRRKLLAEESRTQTSPTGAGAPQTGRATVTGV